MSDIVERLRNWRTVHLARLHLLMEEAAGEIERLRLSASGDCPVPENAASEDKVLTDEERAALARVADDASYRAMERTERVVRRLLERLG